MPSSIKLNGKFSKNFNELIKNKINSKKQLINIEKEAALILKSLGGRPEDNNLNKTVLAIGYVQSGKTTSFQRLIALAGDNGYKLAIIFAGTGNLLLNQTAQRLEDELKGNSYDISITDVNPKPENISDIKDSLSLSDLTVIPVLKHYSHIDKLAELMSDRTIKSLLSNSATLIIDDEADQASHNTFAMANTRTSRNRVSSTYKNIKKLRDVLGDNHSYAQYTATPQAPLLISLNDYLSPDFLCLVSPGDAYVGGKTLFKGKQKANYIKEIPIEDFMDESNLDPPKSLFKAMNIFLLGVSDGIIKDYQNINRSMIVHPTREQTGHRDFHSWIRTRLSYFNDVFINKTLSNDSLIKEMKISYNDLKKTHKDISPFKKLINNMGLTLRRTRAHKINSEPDASSLRWNSAYAHILVGGQSLDRGFTVEGLTVTYMPRSLGIGNADTLQQRCRFFGYKKSYLGLIRIYLNGDAINAYIDYVNSEEDIKNRILRNMDKRTKKCNYETMLKEFILSPSVAHPTRSNILGDGYVTSIFKNWQFIGGNPRENNEMVYLTNKQLVNTLLKNNYLKKSTFSGNTKATLHFDCKMPTKFFYDYLQKIKINSFVSKDRNVQIGMMYILKLIQEKQIGYIKLVYMGNFIRERNINPFFKTTDFQGANLSKGYKGARNCIDHNTITLQIHKIKDTNTNQIMMVSAFHVPNELSTRLIEHGSLNI